MSMAPHANLRAAHTGNDEFLLTPGPLTTSLTVKQAMLRDWGSRDKQFIALNARIREQLVQIAGGEGDYVCVPVQGSGTFAVEATLGTLLPRDGKLLVLVNGAYGERMMKIAKYMERSAIALTCAEDRTPDLASLETLLADDKAITHIAAVHCETTSGILNPIQEIADIVAKHGRSLIIDAMSAFGAIPLDVKTVTCDAVVASSNKCLEGVPGPGRAGKLRGQRPFAGAGPLRSVARAGRQRPMALHPADPCAGGLRPGRRRVRGEGRGAGAQRPLFGKLPHAGGRHARDGLRDAVA
jgi:2-aminoethylphosphonate-pyruvate transaminase